MTNQTSNAKRETESAAVADAGLVLDERTYQQAELCVHCGLCLPACPTYTENGLETDSPRGRIYLMKALADGRIELSDSVRHHLDLCLDCRACETACPSGVVYHELIEETRAKLPAKRKPSLDERLVQWMTRYVMPFPTRLKLALLPMRLLEKVGLGERVQRLAGKMLGERVRKMQAMLPPGGPVWPRSMTQAHVPAAGPSGGGVMKVGLLTGCVGSVMFDPLNRKTAELLAHLGCTVVVAKGQACCGAIPHHEGEPGMAAELAKRNIEAFENVDVIVTHIAGCGAMLKAYDHLLRDEPAWAERAAKFTARVRDISELIVELDPPPPPNRFTRTVTYHDACHLAHGQKVTKQPRKLLEMIEGLDVRPLGESDTCCGAAGTYNLQQPEMATALAKRKIAHIRQTRAAWCATGNVGCAMQIHSQARSEGLDVQVVHPLELLHEAYLGKPRNQ